MSLSTPQIIRYSKAILVFSVGILGLTIVFNNTTDYGTNFEYVRHVLGMDAQRPELAEVSRINYRAIPWTWVHHVGYVFIILLEAVLTVTCLVSSVKMALAARKDDATYDRAKRLGVVGCTIAFIIWFLGFQAIAGEWFAMWMNDSWNGTQDAFRLTACIGVILVYLTLKNDSTAEAGMASTVTGVTDKSRA
jgi:predicted small integral membrane protein